MSNSAYHRHKALSKSNLFLMSKSPAYFRYVMDNPQPSTKALVFGSALHKYVLEPRRFSTEFAVLPNCDRRTVEGKLIYHDFVSSSQGKDIITEDEFTQIQAMRDSVMRTRYAKVLLSGQVERSIFWRDDITGVRVKCRPDVMSKIGGQIYIVDLKSCRDASNDGFAKDAVAYGYTLQSYMYRLGVYMATGQWAKFIFVCVEKDEPYFANIFEADDLFIRHGEEQYREYLGMYKACLDSGKWYGYEGFSGSIQSLTLPAYLAKDYL